MTEPARHRNTSGAPDGERWTQLRTIIDSLADGILLVDGHGIIRFANPAAAALFTRSPESLVGTPLGSPLVAGETAEMEIVRRGGGDVVYAELRVVTTEWEGETAELVSLRDITDRKYAEERLRQLAHEREARIEAEAASRAKSDFLAIMSHELRTPLNAILGYADLIELGISGELSDKVREQVGRIRRSGKHLLSLVNDILDLAKVESGRLSVANESATVKEAVASALALIEPQAAAKNLALVVDPGLDALPPYIGDDERVRQILVNLLSNAVKCTDAGGTITIAGGVTSTPDPRARLQPRSAHIRVTVTDTGSGIPPEQLRAIFEPFVQAETGPARGREGSGLGLTIGLRLARAMGGDITIVSTVGEGSSFSLWLPADVTGLADAQPGRATTISTNIDAIDGSPAPARARPRQPRGLDAVARGILGHLDIIVTRVAERIRADPAIPMAAGMRTTQVIDHLTTLLTDIAGALTVIQETDGDRSPLLADAIEIQRLIAERHGTQRARFAWTEASMRREFMIVREELARVARESMPADGSIDPNDALATLHRFIDQAEYLGVRSLEKLRSS